MFRWTPEATDEQKQQVATELRRLPALLPVLRACHVGPDLGLVEGNFEFAVVPRGIPGLPGQPEAPGDHREVHPADSRPARRGPARVLTRTRPQQFHYPAIHYPATPLPPNLSRSPFPLGRSAGLGGETSREVPDGVPRVVCNR